MPCCDQGVEMSASAINNSEDYIVSEKFAMDLTYSTGGNTSGFTDRFVIVGPTTHLPSNITLQGDSSSYY